MTWSKTGLSLAVLYLGVAVYVVQEELRHTGGGWINLRGILTAIITFPSQATLGSALAWLGVPKVDFNEPGFSGYAQIIAHVLLTALLIYGLGYGLEWVVRRIMHAGSHG